MGPSALWADSLDIIALQTAEKWLGIKPMGLSTLELTLLILFPCRQ